MTALPVRARLLTVVVVLSNVLGNLLLSLGLKTQVLQGIGAYAKALVSPLVVLGVALLILWLLTRMTLLSWADLSYVLPVTSVGYVLSALAGQFFLGEEVSAVRWAGTLLIVIGTAIVGPSQARSRT
jgi:uncharacterized membrane protein